MAHKRKHISLDSELWDWLDRYAEDLGLASRTAAVRYLITREMRTNDLVEEESSQAA